MSKHSKGSGYYRADKLHQIVGRLVGEEREKVVAFARDFARRLSVQTDEQSVGGANAVYLLAEAIEKGHHLGS